jgi:hypothetical protein
MKNVCANVPKSQKGAVRTGHHPELMGICDIPFKKGYVCNNFSKRMSVSWHYLLIYINKMDCKRRILSGLVCTILDWGPNRGGLYG